MWYRLEKLARGLAKIMLVWLTFQLIKGQTDWEFNTGCTILSALWLGLTFLGLRQSLRNYYDLFFRLAVLLPLGTGTVLGLIALVTAKTTIASLLAGGVLIGWAVVYALYRLNRHNFVKAGHGPLPKGTWENPKKFGPGYVGLTDGFVAKELHQPVGHSFIIVQKPEEGTLWILTSLMNLGLVLQPLSELKSENFYVISYPKKPLTALQIEALWLNAQIMLGQNADYKVTHQAKRDRLFALLHKWLPGKFVNKLQAKHGTVDGYDWWGLFLGRIKPGVWTCIAAVLDLLARCGIELAGSYGTGALGLGTSIADPLRPDRLLSEPNLHVEDMEDKAEWDREHPEPQ
jgi:hypothetical protein